MHNTICKRQLAIKPIIRKLMELRLSPTTYESIKNLYQFMQSYIQTGERNELNIPFPEYNCNIKGVLSEENVWVKLEHIEELKHIEELEYIK